MNNDQAAWIKESAKRTFERLRRSFKIAERNSGREKKICSRFKYRCYLIKVYIKCQVKNVFFLIYFNKIDTYSFIFLSWISDILPFINSNSRWSLRNILRLRQYPVSKVQCNTILRFRFPPANYLYQGREKNFRLISSFSIHASLSLLWWQASHFTNNWSEFASNMTPPFRPNPDGRLYISIVTWQPQVMQQLLNDSCDLSGLFSNILLSVSNSTSIQYLPFCITSISYNSIVSVAGGPSSVAIWNDRSLLKRTKD